MARPQIETKVLREIEKRGVLLVTDAALPSVTGLVAGEPVSGSWWSHARAHEIYAVLTSLEEEEGVLLVKLVSKKETFVHRALWPQLLAVATAKEDWQTKALSARARAILEKVEAYGAMRLDEIGRGFDRKALSRAARELEERLLAHGSQVHTEKGAHAKVLYSWPERAKNLNVQFKGIDVAAARGAFEERTTGRLPWQRK
ncbi:MAG: AlkZ-related protein [Vicinamibacteria bacterium]